MGASVSDCSFIALTVAVVVVVIVVVVAAAVRISVCVGALVHIYGFI